LDIWADQRSVLEYGADSDQWVDVGVLAPSAAKSFSVTLPAGAAGLKVLRVFVDSWCELAELNETNNQLTQGYTVGR